METKTLIIGSGLAGMYSALHAAQRGPVTLVTKGRIDNEGSSYWAQGGVAAAIGMDDSPTLHNEDTLKVGRGLCDPGATELLTREGPRHILRLRDLGVSFYAPNGKLDLGLEAGHSRRRIVHALGGGSGKAIVEALIPHMLSNPNITVLDQTLVFGLISDGKECFGALTARGDIFSETTIIATGGAASLYARTTNPPGSLGRGMVMAYEAGASLKDLEFVQFHPTGLVSKTHGGLLISEAVRGEGAHLLDKNGRRFMPEVHEAKELAPRDELTRAIVAQMRKTDHDCVYLSLRHLDETRVNLLFSRIAELLSRAGYNLATDLIPIAPAAHYCMGGIQTDLDGQTTLPGLLAVGEVACTGLHGANRLASNSLMECLVFGERAGMKEGQTRPRPPKTKQIYLPQTPWGELPKLRQKIWDDAGVLRDKESLQRLANTEANTDSELLITLIAKSALLREESRGGHFRTDFPHEDPKFAGYHTILNRYKD